MLIRNIKLSFFCFVLIFLIGCQSDDGIVEKPAELLKIDSKVDLDQKWSKKVFSDISLGRQEIVVDSDGIFSFSSNGRINSFSHLGKSNWETDLKINLSAGIGKSFGSLFVTTLDGGIYSLNSDNGNLEWSSSVNGEILSVPSSNGDIVAVQTTNGKVTALNLRDGKFRWEYVSVLPSLSLRGTSTPVFDNSDLYVGFANGNLAKIEPRSGVVQWEVPVTISKGASEIERLIDVDSRPSISSGIAFAVSYQGDISAINVRSGGVIWRENISSTKNILESNRNVFLVDEDSEVKAFSGLTGISLWKSKDYRKRDLTAPVKIGNYLVVGDFEGYLHFLNIENGKTEGRFRAGRSQIVELKVFENTLASLDNAGRLTYLEVN